jgi:hypothetical protein
MLAAQGALEPARLSTWISGALAGG